MLTSLNLDYFSIIRLATVIMSLSLSAYLFSIKGKSRPTVLLACAFLGATLFNVSMFLLHAEPYYWQPYNLKNALNPFIMALGAALMAVSFLAFAYHFPRFQAAEKGEYRAVITFSAVTNLFVVVLTFYNTVVLQRIRSDYTFNPVYYPVLAGSIALQFLLVVFLLVRKTFRLAGAGSKPGALFFFNPAGKDARAARALACVLLLPLLALISFLLRFFGILKPVPMIYLVSYVFLLFYFSSIVSYLNHTEERTTFQAKLVFGALVVMLGLMGLVGIIVGKIIERDYVDKEIVTDHQTIRFAPNRNLSYTVTRLPVRIDPDMGHPMGIRHGASERIRLDFYFPFFDRAYDVIHVLSAPMIYLGEEARENGWGGYHPRPAIAPIVMNLDPSGGGDIFLKSEAGKATITWHEVPEFEGHSRNSVQLVLFKDGSFDFSYGEVNPDPGNRRVKVDVYPIANITGTVLGTERKRGGAFAPRLVGIHPGGRGAALQPIRFMKDLPYMGAAPGAIFESYEAEYNRYLHERMLPLAFVIMGVSVFILFFFPLLLRTGLIRPLHLLYEGMEKADRGDLDLAISPQFNDEIGYLTRSFNRMLQSIRRAEANFRNLAENARDGILILSAKGFAIYANKRAGEMTGFSVSELEAIDFNALLRTDGFEKIRKTHGREPDEKKASKQFEAFLKTKKGGETPVELTVSETLWHGVPVNVAVVRDITGRKNSEENARRRQQELMKMDKLTSLGILTAGVAHEINNPNQTIQSNASFLVRAGPEVLAVLGARGEENREFLIAGVDYTEFRTVFAAMISGIVECSNRIDGIVKGLKSFSRDEPGDRNAGLNINVVIRTAVELSESFIRKATTNFSLRLEEDIPRIKGNAQRLEQVFINLILNACQSLTSREKGIFIGSAGDEKLKAVRVIVRDEGIGIPKEHFAKIKEPFFSTKRAQGGMGLGLYVSESIVKEHGGTLEFDSAEGKGTAATVTLPAEEDR
jgi:PAS domain S-box-containing protein